MCFASSLIPSWKLPKCLELQNAAHALHLRALAAQGQGAALAQVSAAFVSWGGGLGVIKCQVNKDTILVPVSNAGV